MSKKREAVQPVPAFNAYQKLESALSQRCMVIHSSEGSSARKRLVVNVNCQSHGTLQHQDRADLHNQAMCRSEPVHAHALLTTEKPGHTLARPEHHLVTTDTPVTSYHHVSNLSDVSH